MVINQSDHILVEKCDFGANIYTKVQFGERLRRILGTKYDQMMQLMWKTHVIKLL